MENNTQDGSKLTISQMMMHVSLCEKIDGQKDTSLIIPLDKAIKQAESYTAALQARVEELERENNNLRFINEQHANQITDMATRIAELEGLVEALYKSERYNVYSQDRLPISILKAKIQKDWEEYKKLNIQ